MSFVWCKYECNLYYCCCCCLLLLLLCVDRECVSNLEGMGLPETGISKLHNLAMNVRSLCADTLFQCATTGKPYTRFMLD